MYNDEFVRISSSDRDLRVSVGSYVLLHVVATSSAAEAEKEELKMSSTSLDAREVYAGKSSHTDTVLPFNSVHTYSRRAPYPTLQ